MNNLREMLLYFSLKYNGEFSTIYNAIEKKRAN